MKIKNTYILIIFNILIFQLEASTKSKPATNTNPAMSMPQGMNMPAISEDELKEIIQNAVEEYKKLPESEKELMSQQIGIKKEELDEIMNEAEAFVEEINNNNNKKNTFDQPETFDTKKNKDKIQQPIQKNNSESKNELKEQITILENTIKTLQTLILKSNDTYIREKIINDFDSALSSIEKTIYYLYLIKQFLSNNENQNTIPKTDINKLISIAHKINLLQENIEKLITLNEYEITNSKNDLFEKYSIKTNSNKELKIFLENEIQSLKNKIKEIESDNTISNEQQTEKIKKEQSKKIINIEYKIDILERDLTELETNILENKKQNNQFNEYQKLLNESLNKIIKTLKNIFIVETAVNQIEEIIRKYFPEEYKIGKQKEDNIKKQIAKEKQIAEQKNHSNDIHTEKNIRMVSTELTQKNEEGENSNFHNSNSSNDYEEQNNENEKDHPFDFPKNDPDSSKSTNKDKKEQEKSNNTDSEKTHKNSDDKSDKKQYKDLRHKDKNKDTKNKKNEQKKDLTNINNKLIEIKNTLNKFIEDNQKNLFNQNKTDLLINNLTTQFNELQNSFSNITEETIKIIGDKNPFFKENKIIEIKENNKSYIDNELEKIKLLNINIKDDPLPQIQLISYQLEEIKEIINENFNDNTRKNEFIKLQKTLSILDDINKEFKKICTKLFTKNKDKSPYWLLKKETIETELKEKKELQVREEKQNK